MPRSPYYWLHCSPHCWLLVRLITGCNLSRAPLASLPHCRYLSRCTIWLPAPLHYVVLFAALTVRSLHYWLASTTGCRIRTPNSKLRVDKVVTSHSYSDDFEYSYSVLWYSTKFFVHRCSLFTCNIFSVIIIY